MLAFAAIRCKEVLMYRQHSIKSSMDAAVRKHPNRYSKSVHTAKYLCVLLVAISDWDAELQSDAY